MVREISRRHLLRLFAAAGIGAAIAATRLPQFTQFMDDNAPSTKPDEIFFEVADLFGINRKDPKIAAYMQPPVVEYSTSGCMAGAAGCAASDKVFLGRRDRAAIAHEMGHVVLDKYKNYQKEMWYIKNWPEIKRDYSPDITLDSFLKASTTTYASYAGYHRARAFLIYVPNSLFYKPMFNEFIAFVVEREIGGELLPTWGANDFYKDYYKPAIDLYDYANDTYGSATTTRIAGAMVRSEDPRYLLDENGASYDRETVKVDVAKMLDELAD